MRWLTYIDGVDVYAQYGAYLLGCEGLFGWPELKATEVVVWPDDEGVDINLSQSCVASRKFEISFRVKDVKAVEFLDFIFSTQAKVYDIPSLGINKALRLVGCSEISVIRKLGVVTLTLTNDKPLQEYKYIEPATSIKNEHHKGVLEIDGRDITTYGCVVLAGTTSAMNAYPSVGEVLAVDINGINGERVDSDAPLVKMGRDVTIHLLLRAKDMVEFWRNYNALLYDLIRAGERSVEYIGGISFQAYYQGQKIEDISPPRCGGDGVWVKFCLTLTTLSPFYILSTEDWEVVIDETATYYIRL